MELSGTESRSRKVAAVERALEAIEVLSVESDGLGVNEVARRIGVNPSSASRLLTTLEVGGMVARMPNGRYQLGLRLITLSDRVTARLDVRDLARPHLQGLVDIGGETTTLSIPVSGEAVTIDFVPGKSSVVSMARVGRPNPLHATAIGKAMLAFGDGAKLPTTREMTAFTPLTITSRTLLSEAVEQVRSAGWADAVGEREEDLAALAAPVRGVAGALVAIVGVQGPLTRMAAERRREMLPSLLEATKALSRDLGGSG